MNKEISFNILKSIDDYVKGKLSSSEVDELWVQILEKPEYYPLLRTEAGLRKRYLKKNRWGKKIHKVTDLIDIRKTWLVALAALILMAFFINLMRSQLQNEIAPVMTEISFLHLISPDITRASADQLSEFDQALHHSFQLAVTGKRQEAINGYQKLLAESDKIKNHTVLNYNLGIVYYNTGDYIASARHFQKVECPELNDFAYIESCYWLRTNSFLATQNLEGAYDSAINTLNMNGSYTDDAREILQKLHSDR